MSKNLCDNVIGVLVVHFVKLHVFTFLVSCCNVPYDFLINTMFGSSLPLFVLSGVHVSLMVFVLIYVYWCPLLFPY
jgi:hypothetical protein